MSNDNPSLITFSEFIASVKKKQLVESIGGFSFWMQRNGMPKKWSQKMWQEKLDQYLNRKV